MPTEDVHEQRRLLRSLLVSNYGEFKATVLGDMLGTLPVGKTWSDLIEEYLRKEYGDAYQPENAAPRAANGGLPS